MRKIRRYFNFFDRLNHEIRMISVKRSIITAFIFLLPAIISWIAVGRIDKVMLLYIFPRCAMPIFLMYIFWGCFFALSGIILAGIVFGCEKFRRNRSYKSVLFIILMQFISYTVYPLFFGALSTWITFFVLLVAQFLSLCAIIASSRSYCLWTVLLTLQYLWLIYNCYVTLAFSFVN